MVAKADTDFEYHNFLLVLFDWYYPHLYYVPEELQKFSPSLFSPPYKYVKACNIIPLLCEHKIVKQWWNELARVYSRLKNM